jgi:cytidylate kinase
VESIIITIDGPAGSGKSTTAKIVAELLGYIYVDSGAMYRAVTLATIRHKCETIEQIIHLLDSLHIELKMSPQGQRTFLNGEDISEEIREQIITSKVSFISSIKEVRTAMVDLQRKIGAKGSIVMDGRDIGTVVFPHAQLKIFMIASIHERAKRRLDQMKSIYSEHTSDITEITEQITNRDYADSHREIDPLKPADDAIMLDTTGMSIQEQCDFIVKKAQQLIFNE